jgi:hypothetical protein
MQVKLKSNVNRRFGKSFNAYWYSTYQLAVVLVEADSHTGPNWGLRQVDYLRDMPGREFE